MCCTKYIQVFAFAVLVTTIINFIAWALSLHEKTRNTVNVLLVGPFGNGKSLLHNLMISVLSYNRERRTISNTGSGVGHTTKETIYTDAYTYLPQISGMPLRITDTMGISDSNFQNGFFDHLLSGIVPAHRKGADGGADLDGLVGEDINKTHVVVFVVAHHFLSLSKNNPTLMKLHDSITVAKDKGKYNLLVGLE